MARPAWAQRAEALLATAAFCACNEAPRAIVLTPERTAAPSATASTPAATPPRPEASPVASPSQTQPCPLPEIPSDMLPVPGGTFQMGADDEGEQDERPRHAVTVQSFLLDVTEVTHGAYSECVKASACSAPDSLAGSALTSGHPEEFRKPDHPVSGVAWADAVKYCEFRGKRLPTEAEWERAARGDDGRRYVWGNDAPDPKRHGVFGGRPTTDGVGKFTDGKGPYGHLDLAGNVWEWVADLYDPYAYRRETASQGIPGSCEQILETLSYLRRHHLQGFTGKNPIPSECERVLRGGAYNYGTAMMRASNRVHHPASFRIAVAGFRCARDLPSPPSGCTPSAGASP